MRKEKSFNVRLSKDLWVFLKRKAMDEDTSMNNIVLHCIEKLKRKHEKKVLTNNDAKVQ